MADFETHDIDLVVADNNLVWSNTVVHDFGTVE